MKMPRAWIEANTEQKDTTKISAALTIGEGIADGICPVTGAQMEKMYANGHEVWCNFDERIVLPVKDK